MNYNMHSATYRAWEYARKGDYHRNLDPNWSYTPTYLQKMSFVRQFIEGIPRHWCILDAGCGEGVLVEEFRKKGRNIQGLDLNYESEFVCRGDIRAMPYSDAAFDVVLLLDTLEHLSYEDQPKALAEIRRVLKPRGLLVISVPNLAHFNSRLRLFLRGQLDRTDAEENHCGERPEQENICLLREAGFKIMKCVGITFTLPFLYRRVICKRPAKFRWLHDLMEPLARLAPSLAMLNIFVCQQNSAPPTHSRAPLL